MKADKVVLFSIELMVVWLVILPVLSYYTILYYKSRNTTHLSKRNTALVISTSIFCICYTTIGRTMSILGHFDFKIEHNRAIEVIDTIMWIVPVFALLNILFLRSFALNYQIRYNMITETGLWMQHINKKSTQEINWYYTHQNTFGNVNWVIKRISIPISIAELVLLFTFNSRFTHFINDFYYFTTIAVFLLLLIVGIWVIYYKTPFYADIFQLRGELKRVVYIGFVGFVSFLTYNVLDGTGIVSHESSLRFCLWMVSEIIIDLVFFGVAMGSTYWVLKNSIHIDDICKTTEKSIKDKCKPKLRQCLAEYSTFQAFMSHLCKEFSSESLLFLYEASQYKNLFRSIELTELQRTEPSKSDQDQTEIIYDEESTKRNYPMTGLGNLAITSLDNVIYNEELIIFAEEIPKSDIVQKNSTIYDKVRLLSKKYIEMGAVLEVNLPYLMRVAIVNKCQEIDCLEKSELCHIFDAAIGEILLLISDSFARFTISKEYIMLNLNT